MDPISNVSLSPNPATTKINVTASERIKAIIILTITGEEVMNRPGDNNKFATVPIGILPNGLYNVKVVTDNGTSTTLLYKAA
ncbi:MAG: T9SS type A sorting domain-containing protein [Bacteroidota bacterium]